MLFQLFEMNLSDCLHIHESVKGALAAGMPIVALESTIISHGMPYPQNVETALRVEEKVRSKGAVPATIALINGKCVVGLDTDQIEQIGKQSQVSKVSLRDMSYILSTRAYGATTVAATMRIAYMAGIRFFVTGGIGGVHRGAERSMDISADLTELGQTPVAVVSSGVKSILDIGRTLEYLETLGVPVVTLGQTVFPSFYSRESEYASPLSIDTPAAIAEFLKYQWAMKLNKGVLIANPIPSEMEIPAEHMEVLIQKALSEADQKKIKGKEVTPFLLKWIADHSNGESLEANIQLILHNASTGAEIAVAGNF
jgi:pseudouridine-5'-phosphate glycosidase